MLDKLKRPLALIALGGALLTIIGSLMGWFSLSSTNSQVGELANSVLGDFSGSRQTTAIVVSLIAGFLAVMRSLSGKRWLSIIAAVLLVVPMIIIGRQIDQSGSISVIELKLTVGYWLSLAGVLLQFGAAIAMAIKRDASAPVVTPSAASPESAQPVASYQAAADQPPTQPAQNPQPTYTAPAAPASSTPPPVASSNPDSGDQQPPMAPPPAQPPTV
jgi:hypothetical protein